jgi:hypothetical protein
MVQSGEGQLGQPLGLQARLTNAGLQDATGLSLAATAEWQGEALDLGTYDVEALSGEPARVAIDWQPPLEGAWEVKLQVMDADGAVVAQLTRPVEVAPAEAALSFAVPAAASHNSYLGPWLLVLGLASLVAGAAAVYTRQAVADGADS